MSRNVGSSEYFAIFASFEEVELTLKSIQQHVDHLAPMVVDRLLIHPLSDSRFIRHAIKASNQLSAVPLRCKILLLGLVNSAQKTENTSSTKGGDYAFEEAHE